MPDQITTELDLPLNSLVERGYKVKYKPEAWDDDSFYRIVSSEKWQSFGHPKAARSEIEKVQTDKDHLLFFLAFEPKCDTSITEAIDLKENLKNDLNTSKAARAIPTRRDIYAAAEFLQKTIHMIYWHPNDVQKEVFNPPFSSHGADDIIYILSVSQENKTAFIQLTKMEDAAVIDIAKHSQCHGMTFRRSFSHRPHATRETNTELSEGSWEVDKSVEKSKRNFLFCSLSKAFYGTQGYHWYVRELIVKFLREETLAEVFFESKDEEADKEKQTLTEKQKVTKKKTEREEYISSLQKESVDAGRTELYAAAFIFRTRVFVQRPSQDYWDAYFPLCVPENTRQRSYITLEKFHKLLVSRERECNCLLREPPVEYLDSISRERLMSLATKFVVKTREQVCCPGEGRHGRHRHLDAFCQTTTKIQRPQDRHMPSPDVPGIDGRTLDKVSGESATFQHCLHKLIYGTDEVSEDFEVREEAPDKNYLECIAQWLQKSIFVYSSLSSSWEVYNPDEGSDIEKYLTGERKKCRYYITLFYDHCADRYDIITPLEGCNCALRPPTFDKSNSDEKRFIRKEDRHNPLVEFFLDDGVNNCFSDEKQKILPTEGGWQICEAYRRPDMKFREVDEGHGTHTLFTCISMEIFGNEEQAAKIEELVTKEMLENAGIYVSLLDVKSRLKHSTTTLQQEVDKTLVPFLLLFGHLPLLAAATVFQTPIYVLKVEPTEEKGWKSSWCSFTQVRRKNAPRNMPSIQSKCRQDGNSDSYYVTLLQDPYGNFFRIIPNGGKVCNCQLKEPNVPEEYVSFPLLPEKILSKSIASQRQLDWEVADAEITQKFRELDNALGKNLQNLRQMKKLVSTQLLMYDVIVALFEGRRRNINIASIAGSSTSTVGTVLLILGIALAPVTMGSTLGLTVAGGVISVVGSAGVIGSRVVEGALTKYQLRALIVIHELLDTLSKDAAQSNDTFLKLVSEMASFVEGDVGDLGENTSGIGLGMSPAVGRLMGSFHIVPIIIARATAQVSSIIVGSVVGGLSLFIDAAIIAYAAYNLNKGNKTSTSEIIRKNAHLLKAINEKLESYVHGNVK